VEQLQAYIEDRRVTASFSPHQPTARQKQFLDLDCLEAFYGGSAGPGKSDALLQAALQYVNVPGYSAILFRRTYPLLSNPGSLIPRAKEWLLPQGIAWHESRKTFTFPSGATLTFGHLDHDTDKYDYASTEFQFIGFDELTEFDEPSYRFLFSRLRRRRDIDVPLRFRAGSNPGGRGHDWVQDRFITDDALDDLLRRGIDSSADTDPVVYWKEGRAFVPALLRDNPYIDADEYMLSLNNLDPVTRARLVAGDWRVRSEGVFKQDWLRYYIRQGENDYGILAQGGSKVRTPVAGANMLECMRFITVDCAASSDDVVKERKTGRKSLSVSSCWDFHPRSGLLLWRSQRSGYWGFTELVSHILDHIQAERPSWTGVEGEKTGKALLSVLRNHSVRELSHQGKDKLTRASQLLNMAEQGHIVLPLDSDFTAETERELLTWTGHPEENCDRIDTAAYAAIHTHPDRAGPLRLKASLITGLSFPSGRRL
jgi:hypothetical protein